MGWFRGLFKADSGPRLLEAAARGNLTEVERLLRDGAPVDWADDRGLTPLIMACYGGKTGVVRALLDHGANPSKANADGEVPLLVCANTSACRDLVPLLLGSGADPLAKARDGRTALFVHAQRGSAQAVAALLAAGADLDAATDDGATALHVAIDQGHFEVVRHLLAAGANPEARLRAASATALGLALLSGRDEIARLLLEYCDPNDAAVQDQPALIVATRAGRAAMLSALIAKGAAIDFVLPEVGSALGVAAVTGSLEAVEVLLAAGASLSASSPTGAQALHLAAYSGELSIVRRLIEAGADLHALTGPKGTPLRAAAAQGHLEVVRYLLDLGADPAPVDAFDRRPHQDATDAGHLAIAQLLEGAPRRQAPARTPARRSHHVHLPPRNDASLNGVRSLLDAPPRSARVGCSSVEAPTMVAAIREVIPEFEVTFIVDEPDPRVPRSPVDLLLWRYPDRKEGRGDAVPVPPPPSALVGERIARLAATPYLLELWSDRARAAAQALGPHRATEVAATMVHPAPRPEYLTTWDWRFRCQVAAALVLAHLEQTAMLRDLLDGPVDWAATAAILAFFDLAHRSPEAREDATAMLLHAFHAPENPPNHQHLKLPAAEALRDLPGISEATAAELEHFFAEEV